jgi:hypothetical protein
LNFKITNMSDDGWGKPTSAAATATNGHAQNADNGGAWGGSDGGVEVSGNGNGFGGSDAGFGGANGGDDDACRK